MYTTAGEPGEEDHYKDFLETVGFLFGREEPKEELRESLNELRTEMLRLDETSRDRVLEIRARIEALLRRVMVRTERPGGNERPQRNAGDGSLKPTEAREL